MTKVYSEADKERERKGTVQFCHIFTFFRTGRLALIFVYNRRGLFCT